MSYSYTQYLIRPAALPEGPRDSALSILHSVQLLVTPFSQDWFLIFSGSLLEVRVQ